MAESAYDKALRRAAEAYTKVPAKTRKKMKLSPDTIIEGERALQKKRTAAKGSPKAGGGTRAGDKKMIDAQMRNAEKELRDLERRQTGRATQAKP